VCSSDLAHQLLAVQAAVAVADDLFGQGIDAGVACEFRQSEFGQLAIVARGEVPAHVEDLGCHEMEVVEEPFRRGGDELPLVHIVGHGDVGHAKEAGVVLEARQDAPRLEAGVRVEGEPGRERSCPLFQSFDAQQFVAQGLFSRMRSAAAEKAEKRFQGLRHRDA
jgi:hypothetical protein